MDRRGVSIPGTAALDDDVSVGISPEELSAQDLGGGEAALSVAGEVVGGPLCPRGLGHLPRRGRGRDGAGDKVAQDGEGVEFRRGERLVELGDEATG